MTPAPKVSQTTVRTLPPFDDDTLRALRLARVRRRRRRSQHVLTRV